MNIINTITSLFFRVKHFLPLPVLLMASGIFAQNVSYHKTKITTPLAGKIFLSENKIDYMPSLHHIEAPMPGGEVSEGELEKLKKEARKRFPIKNTNRKSKDSAFPHGPIVGKNFRANTYNNSSPNDNHMAISNDGKLISVVNKTIYGYDMNKDSIILLNSLAYLSTSLGLKQNKYDPRVLYDPEEDRFIVIFLNGTSYQSSKIIVGFSASGDPAGEWNLYALEGNPIDNNTWSDYPIVGLNKNDLFVAMNTFYNGSSNYSGFAETTLWQIDKTNGYDGDASLSSNYYHDIFINGSINDSASVVSVTPIKGGSGLYGPNMYFLCGKSRRAENDTIYLLETTNSTNNTTTALKATILRADRKYYLPPDARQKDGHIFRTNDARILGGFYENNKIQYVQCVMDTSTGLAGVYHGFISDVTGDPQITGNIFSDPILDLGFPNIAYTGKQECDDESIITLNHTAPTVFGGFSAFYYSNNNTYSDLITIVDGDNYCNVYSGTYERWGDYSGIQRKYNEPGKVWASGYHCSATNKNETWISELTSPDSSIMTIELVSSEDASEYGICDGEMVISKTGGIAPYRYLWDLLPDNSDTIAKNLCAGTYKITVIDSFNCSIDLSTNIEQPDPEHTIFPNPAQDEFNVSFTINDNLLITITLFDSSGNEISILFEGEAEKGKHIFSFSTRDLKSGLYMLQINNGSQIIVREKVLKI